MPRSPRHVLSSFFFLKSLNKWMNWNRWLLYCSTCQTTFVYLSLYTWKILLKNCKTFISFKRQYNEKALLQTYYTLPLYSVLLEYIWYPSQENLVKDNCDKILLICHFIAVPSLSNVVKVLEKLHELTVQLKLVCAFSLASYKVVKTSLWPSAKHVTKHVSGQDNV